MLVAANLWEGEMGGWGISFKVCICHNQKMHVYLIFNFNCFSGQEEIRYPNGNVQISFSDGSVKKIFSDGTEETKFPDGTQVSVAPSGDRTLLMPNGQKEFHTSNMKVKFLFKSSIFNLL